MLKKTRFTLFVLVMVAMVSAGFASTILAGETVITFGRPAIGPGYLEPHHTGSAASYLNLGQVYETLVEYSHLTGQVEPLLAESFEYSDDFRTWTFYIREGITFHDGSKLTAHDVKFTFERMLSIGETTVAAWLEIGPNAEITVLDDYTVEFSLQNPYPAFPIELTYNCYGIISPRFIAEKATDSDPYAFQYTIRTGTGVGTGPFKFSAFEPEQYLILEKNENYWGGVEGIKSAAKIDRLVMNVIPDATTRRLMLERGDLDIADGLPSHILLELEEISGIKVEAFPMQISTLLILNTSKPHFADANVRRAIAYALNYDSLINDIEGGLVERLIGLVPKGMLSHNPDMFSYSRNLEKAKEYMASSSYPDGFETEIIWANARRSAFDEVAPIIQANLQEIGISARLRQVAFASQLERTAALDHEISLMLYVHGTGDPDILFSSMYPPGHPGYKSEWSYTWVDSPDIIAQLVQEGSSHYNPDIRAAVYNAAQRITMDLAPVIPLYQVSQAFAMRDDLEGLIFDQQRRGTFWNLHLAQ